MTPAAFATYVRNQTHTNSVTLTDATILAYLAVRTDYLAGRIIQADEDYFGSPETTDIVNAQREYALPSDILTRIKAVEFTPDPTDNPPSPIRMLPLDLSLYNRTTDENTIQANFANIQDKAFYDIFRGSLWLYTGALSGFVAGNAALKIWTYQWPTPPVNLTEAVTDMSIPQSPTQVVLPRNFHYCLALLVQIDYKNSFDKPVPLTQQELAVESEIVKTLSQIVPASTEDSPVGELPDANHSYNYGFDL